MAAIERILVSIHNRDDATIVLEKACRLASATRASLHVIRVIYEGFAELSVHDIETSTQLKTALLQAEEVFLEELIAPWRDKGIDMESATIWHKGEWQGILELADDCDAQLIIKGTETDDEGAFRTPDDWNLLRHAPVPVMMIKPVAWGDDPVILAAIDASDDGDEKLNIAILTRAKALAEQLGGELHIVTAYPSYDKWVDPATISIEYDAIHKAIRDAVRQRVEHLVGKAGVKPKAIHIQQGYTHTIIGLTVNTIGAQLLIMGTHHRTGAAGMFLGNTSEEILHTVKCDVEVLH